MPILFKVQAIYDFKGELESDLPFKKGDQIKVYGKAENGWWLGRIAPNGIAGYFPSNFVDKNNIKYQKNPSISGKLRNRKIKKDVYQQKYAKFHNSNSPEVQ